MNSINQHFEIGCYTLVEWDVNPLTGKKLDARTRIQQLLETIDLADQVGQHDGQ